MNTKAHETGTNGLGAQSAIHLAKHNAAHIYISGRNAQAAEKVISQIRATNSKTEVTFLECDLASLSSVKQTAETPPSSKPPRNSSPKHPSSTF